MGREILPCKVNLLRRKITNNDMCDECGRRESVFHVMYECKSAKAVWKLAPRFSRFWKEGSGFQCLKSAMTHDTNGEVQRWALICWCIWVARNKKIFDGVCKSAKEVIEEANCLLNGFRKNTECVRVPKLMQVSPGARKWSKPEKEFVKLNCDASFTDQAGVWVSFIARDERGTFCFAGNKEIFGAKRCGKG